MLEATFTIHYLLCAHPTGDEDSVILAGGSRSSEGRVEIRINGTWSTICDPHFSLYDAQVICHVLGYYVAENYTYSSVFGAGEYPPLFTLGCTGSEELIQNWLISNSSCLVATRAGVKCYDGQWCTCLTSVHIYILPLWLCMQLFGACVLYCYTTTIDAVTSVC